MSSISSLGGASSRSSRSMEWPYLASWSHGCWRIVGVEVDPLWRLALGFTRFAQTAEETNSLSFHCCHNLGRSLFSRNLRRSSRLWSTSRAKVGLSSVANIVTASCQAKSCYNRLVLFLAASRDCFWCAVRLKGRLGGTQQQVMFVVDILSHLSLVRLEHMVSCGIFQLL